MSADRVGNALNPIMKRRLLIAVVLACTIVVAPAALPAHATAGDPIGYFDSASVRLSGVFFYGLSVWEIYGWAADVDAPGASRDVHVYIDGQPQYVVHTDQPRPDVAAVYPFAGGNSGWQAGIVAASNQPHTVCTYAMNVGAGTENTTLGCIDIPAQGPEPGDPSGHLEAVTDTAGSMRFQGWAGDPDPDVTDPSDVRPFIDGQPYFSVHSTLPRPDVRAAFPALANAGGFDQTIAIPPGRHLYCVDVGNAGRTGGNNPSLGCGVVDVPGPDPVGPDNGGGSWDATVYTSSTAEHGPTVTYEGWAWDPTSDGPATVRVRDVVNGFVTGFLDTQSVDDYQTSEPRPDVRAAYPDAPLNTGFKITYDIQYYNPHTPTDVYRCFYVDQTVGERLIGCAPLTTRSE